MDDLPVLDFSCSEEFQLKDQGFVRRLHSHDLVTEEIPFLGSRGCAFHCTYCCNAKLRQTYAGTGYYVRNSVAGFVDRAVTLRKQYFPGGKRVFFVDDDFLDRSMAELEDFSTTYPARVGFAMSYSLSHCAARVRRMAGAKRPAASSGKKSC